MENDFFELVHQLRSEGVLSVGVLKLLQDNQRAFGQFTEELRDGRFKLSEMTPDTLRDIYLAAGVSEELLEKQGWDNAWRQNVLVYVSGAPQVPLLREMREFGVHAPSYNFSQEATSGLSLKTLWGVEAVSIADGPDTKNLIGFEAGLALLVAARGLIKREGLHVVSLSGRGSGMTAWFIRSGRLESAPFNEFTHADDTYYLVKKEVAQS